MAAHDLSTWRLALRGLIHFRRTNVGVALGVAIAAAVLVGALVVGDSVRLSLREQALDRIGRVDAAVVLGERTFAADLVERLAAAPGLPADLALAPALQLPGVASLGGGGARAGIVDVWGIDARFLPLSRAGSTRDAPGVGEAFINARLAAHLGVGLGDAIVVRVEKPSPLPRDMAMATVDDVSFALRVEVRAVLDDAEFGRFGLRASQIPPFNVFVGLDWVQRELELNGRANLLVAATDETSFGDRSLVDTLSGALGDVWELRDAQLEVGPAADVDGVFELSTDRIFLDDVVVDAVAQLDDGLVGVLTYFVNRIERVDAGDGRGRGTPYSTVSAIGPLSGDAATVTDPVLAELVAVTDGVGEGLLANEWLAEDLAVSVGSGARARLDYWVVGDALELVERSHELPILGIVPLAGPAADPSLMPAFPGLAESVSCRDWEPGVPVELEQLRPVDERYWEEHRGTPKAFVSLATGRAIWGNRFGSLTAVRGPIALLDRVRDQLPLDPAAVGLFFQDLAGPARAAGTTATDFGGLFLGLSFFLIVAALLLTALLFVFGAEQRAGEIGTLLAVGFPVARVRRLLLVEGLVLAVVGGALGAIAGIGYTEAVLAGLASLWRDAVGATALALHVRPGTLVGGAVGAVVTALLALALGVRQISRRPATELLAAQGGGVLAPAAAARDVRPGRRRLAVGLAILCVALAVTLVATAPADDAVAAAGAFFGAGALVLIAGLVVCRSALRSLGAAGVDARASIGSVGALATRSAGRRPGRSLATIALLASGVFLVVAVQANRLEPPRDVERRSSGTGGFALFGRSTLPVLRDLATPVGQDAYGLEPDDLADASLVPLRVRDGDDASCLNLSLPQNPQLWGVDSARLASRGAFTFAGVFDGAGELGDASPWTLLARTDAAGDDVVPAIGDAASVTWALHKGLGDTLDYVDERGRTFRVRIVATVANSILQGTLLIDEARFEQRFPSTSGYRAFLVDAPADRVEPLAETLGDALADVGLELTATADRLAAFQAVQNTYLLIFQLLGGLGLLLGSAGLGMVVLRNVAERRAELALLRAVGYRVGAVRKLLRAEHVLLLGLGLGVGLAAALVAVLPAVGGGGGGASATAAPPPAAWPIVLLVAGVGASGLAWVEVAVRAALARDRLLEALHDD